MSAILFDSFTATASLTFVLEHRRNALLLGNGIHNRYQLIILVCFGYRLSPSLMDLKNDICDVTNYADCPPLRVKLNELLLQISMVCVCVNSENATKIFSPDLIRSKTQHKKTLQAVMTSRKYLYDIKYLDIYYPVRQRESVICPWNLGVIGQPF